jgi:hypothetical protein
MRSTHLVQNTRRCLFFSALLVASVVSSFAFGSHDSGKAQNPVIRGAVWIIGNEPHTMVTITSEDGSKSYLVVSQKNEKEIRDLQGRLVDFTVSTIEKPTSPVPPGIDGAVEVISWKIVK